MSTLEVVILENAPHPHNLIRAQGYHVGDTPHEAEGIHPLGPLPRAPHRVNAPVAPPSRRHHQRVSREQVPIIKQHHCRPSAFTHYLQTEPSPLPKKQKRKQTYNSPESDPPTSQPSPRYPPHPPPPSPPPPPQTPASPHPAAQATAY